MEPREAADTLRTALARLDDTITVADASARSGLALRDAERGLHRLLSAHRGHLSVTDKGQLLFHFPNGFAIDWERRGRWRGLARAVGRGVGGLAGWVVRAGLTVFLVGYAALFAVLFLVAGIAVSVLAEDSGPIEGAGLIVWGFGELIVDALFWTTHSSVSLRTGEGEGREPRKFYERVNRFFFGPPVPRDDPRDQVRRVAAEIRAQRGSVGLADVMRVTGLGHTEASALTSRLLVEMDGDVDVTEAGAIVYRFDELLPSTEAPAGPTPWRQLPDHVPMTGNGIKHNVVIVMLLAFVGGAGWLGMQWGLPFWLGALPFWACLGFGLVPLLRAPLHLWRRVAIRATRGRVALMRAAFEAAQAGRPAAPEQLRAAWSNATGQPIDDADLQRKLIEMGADVILDDAGGWHWRFEDLELELSELKRLRGAADPQAREVGEVEFTSLPEPTDS